MSDRTRINGDDTNNEMAENFSNETYALTDEQKERIYSTISRKLNIEMTDSGKAVTGVEKCSRNQLFHTITTAASAAALIAALSINFSALQNMKKSISEISAADGSITADVTSAQDVPEEMHIQTGQYQAVVNEPVTTADHYIKAISVSISERILSTCTQTSTTADTSSSETETSAEISDTETTETEAEYTVTETDEQDNGSQEETSTQADEPSEENELQKAAEYLIAEYDNILKIKSFSILKEDDDNKLTIIHESYQEGSEPLTLTYCPVDPEIYPDMDTMRNYYYTVICSSHNEDSCFGPEFRSEDYPDGLLLSGSSPEYAYITYDGRLYGLDLIRPVFKIRTDEPAVVYNIADCGFSAEKKYKDTRDENIVTTADFSIVKDTQTGNYVILNVNYN